MSFGGLIYYATQLAERISASVAGKCAPNIKSVAPCVGCCHVDACKNTVCPAHPVFKKSEVEAKP